MQLADGMFELMLSQRTGEGRREVHGEEIRKKKRVSSACMQQRMFAHVLLLLLLKKKPGTRENQN